MRLSRIPLYGIAILLSTSCVPVEKISRHDFDSGFYRLKAQGTTPLYVYASVNGNSINVYPVKSSGKSEYPDTLSFREISITKTKTGDYFYRSCFVGNSVDVDLTPVILKFRPPLGEVPNQLSSNVNAAIYSGFRRDFIYKASWF